MKHYCAKYNKRFKSSELPCILKYVECRIRENKISPCAVSLAYKDQVVRFPEKTLEDIEKEVESCTNTTKTMESGAT